MLDTLLARAKHEWHGWFPDETVPVLEPILLAGGPAHRDRVSVLLFAAGRRVPQVIMKVGFTPREGVFLAAEFEAMDQLRPQLPSDLKSSMPRALDLFQAGGATAVSAQVLEGRRLLVPSLTGNVSTTARRMMDSFFRRSFAFSRDLARVSSSSTPLDVNHLVEVTERFIHMFFSDEPQVERRIRSFGRTLGHTPIEWRPAWQHQDVAVGNVLEHRGQLRFVDWEHAGEGCQPWFDVAYAPIVTSHLAGRVDRLPSVRLAALAVLGSDTPIGLLLQERMEEVWDFPLPLSWGVTLTAMIGAMRRLDDERAESPEWADLVRMMLCDDEFRRHVAWLAPQW